MSKDDSREPRLRNYAECLARDLRAGYLAEVWTEAARAYVFRRVTQVEHTGTGTGKPRVHVWYEGIPLSREYMPGDRFRITPESFEQVQIHGDGVPPGCPHAGARQSPCPVCAPPGPARQVFATCRWGGHLLHREAGADAAPWLDKEGRRYCPRRPTGPVPPGLPGGHQPAAGEHRFYAACRWGGHLLHRETGTEPWKDDCGCHTCPGRPLGRGGLRYGGHEAAWEKPAPPPGPEFVAMPRLAAAAREAQEELAARPPGLPAGYQAGLKLERDLVGAMRRSLEKLRKIAGEQADGYQWRQAEEAIYGTLSTALDAGYWEGRAAGAPEPDYLALAAKAAPRWGICPHGCFHRASHAGVCVECGCPTSTLVQGSFAPRAHAPTAEDRMEAAVDAAMAAIPCSCDPADTSAGTVHQLGCDTEIPPDVVRKMHEAWLRHLASEPPSAPQKPAPPAPGDSAREYRDARLRAAAARERARQQQATSTAMHSHDGYTLHSHAVRPDHRGVDQADPPGLEG